MTRTELLEALRAAGYTGPTSYTKSRLEELLAATTEVLPPVEQTDEEWEGEVVQLDEWRGLRGPHHVREKKVPGTAVKIEGIARKKFEFISYYRSESQEYVTVRGPLPNHGNTRYIEPKRILHGLNGRPIVK